MKINLKRLRLSRIVLVCAIVFPMQAHATFIHTYQGNNYASFSSPTPFTGALAVTGYFVTGDPLEANTVHALDTYLQEVTFLVSNGIFDFSGGPGTVSVARADAGHFYADLPMQFGQVANHPGTWSANIPISEPATLLLLTPVMLAGVALRVGRR